MTQREKPRAIRSSPMHSLIRRLDQSHGSGRSLNIAPPGWENTNAYDAREAMHTD